MICDDIINSFVQHGQKGHICFSLGTPPDLHWTRDVGIWFHISLCHVSRDKADNFQSDLGIRFLTTLQGPVCVQMLCAQKAYDK